MSSASARRPWNASAVAASLKCSISRAGRLGPTTTRGGAREAAGLPDRFAYDSRRTAVRRLERAGVPCSQAMKLVGHKTESIYRRYAISNEAGLREAVAKVAADTREPRRVVPLDSDKTGTAG